MKNTVTEVVYTGYNTCEIAEFTTSKNIEYDHIEINENESIEIEGFPVYLMYEDIVEDLAHKYDEFLEFDSSPIEIIFNNYYEGLYERYEKSVNRYSRMKKPEFLKQIINSEKKGLYNFQSYIDKFPEIENESKFLQSCNEFIKWLEDKPEGTQGNKPELTLKQIALKYVYENKQIIREKADEIAIFYKHNSGEKLFQHYTFFSSTANRKGKPTPCTKITLRNKIELFESVIKILPKNCKQRATDDLTILKSISDKDY